MSTLVAATGSPLMSPRPFTHPLGFELNMPELYDSTMYPQEMLPNDRTAARELREELSSRDMGWLLSPAVLGGGREFKVARFMRFSEYDVDGCISRLVDYAIFRHLWQLGSLTIKDVRDDILTYQYFFLPEDQRFHSGDRVLCLHLAYPDGVPAFERIFKAFLYTAEAVDNEMAESFTQCGYIVSFRGYKIKSYTGRYERTVIHLVEHLYPCRASVSFAMHAPLFIRLLYKIASSYIPPHLRRCVVIVSPTADLSSIIDPGDLPTMFGGASRYTAQDFVADREAVDPPDAPPHTVHPALGDAMRGIGAPADLKDDSRVILRAKGHKRITTGRWKHYIIILTQHGLLYYKNEQATVPNNGILLCRAEVVSTPSHVVQGNRKRVVAVHSDDRVYEFSFKTKGIANEWRHRLEECIAKSRAAIMSELCALAETES